MWKGSNRTGGGEGEEMTEMTRPGVPSPENDSFDDMIFGRQPRGERAGGRKGPPSGVPVSNGRPPGGAAGTTSTVDDMVAEQDQLLGRLHHTIIQTRDKSGLMSKELEDHDGLIDDIQTTTDRNRMEVRSQNRRVVDYMAKFENNKFWTAVIVLVLLIVILLAIPAPSRSSPSGAPQGTR